MIALERMRQIFTAGLRGKVPIVPTDFPTLEKRALACMSKEARNYIAGGAGLEYGINNNQLAFRSHKIIPRILTGVGDVDTSVEMFGRKIGSPLLFAPIGVLDLAYKGADLSVASVAASLDIPMIISNQGSHPMEQTFESLGDTAGLFQLYWSKSNELVESLIGRAEKCGASALVVTLDTPILGWRPRDLNMAHLPFLRGMGIAQYISDPVFQRLIEHPPDYIQMDTGTPKVNRALLNSMHQMLKNLPGSYLSNAKNKYALSAIRLFINIYSRPSIQWTELQWLRSITSLPILLKGVLHPDDAIKALDYGMDGVVVSNHGGRQVDDVIASLDALPSIVSAMNGQGAVLLDSGIRSGTDIFKALALGAQGVLIGRPYVYGLALDGAKGAADVMLNLIAELEITMTLCGCDRVTNISKNSLLRI